MPSIYLVEAEQTEQIVLTRGGFRLRNGETVKPVRVASALCVSQAFGAASSFRLMFRVINEIEAQRHHPFID